MSDTQIDQLLEKAVKLDNPTAKGHYTGAPTPEVKAKAQELLDSIQGVGPRRDPSGWNYREPEVRVDSHGSIQLIWHGFHGAVAVSVRDYDPLGNVGLALLGPGDEPPLPDGPSANGMGAAVDEIVMCLSAREVR